MLVNQFYGQLLCVKATIEIEDDLFRRAKATAALQGRSVKAYVADALHAQLQAGDEDGRPTEPGWRSVFGCADADAIAEVSAVIDAEFSRIDPATWE